MTKSYDQYRKIGREKVKPFTTTAVIIFLIAGLITGIWDSFQYKQTIDVNGEAVTSTVYYLSWVTIFFVGVMGIGTAFVSKKIYYGQEPKIEDLFFGFKDYVKSFLLGLVHTIIISVGLALLIVPGVIWALKYSMVYYVKLDNPDLDTKACLEKSKEIMNGHKSDYLGFVFSWIGWFLLGIITCGILFLWISPWYSVAKYEYYLDITGKNNKTVDAEVEF